MDGKGYWLVGVCEGETGEAFGIGVSKLSSDSCRRNDQQSFKIYSTSNDLPASHVSASAGSATSPVKMHWLPQCSKQTDVVA